VPQRFIPVAAPRADRPMTRIQSGFAARRNVLAIIPALTYRQPMVTGNMLIRWHMLADPTSLKRVLLDNLENYPKSEIMRRMLRPAIGNSLFNADGAEWRWQRRAVVPVFTHRNVVTLAPPMSATAERASERLMACGGRAEMVAEMLTSTFDVICDVALSGREHFDAQTFGRAITRYFQTAGRASLLDFLGVPQWMPRPGEMIAGSSVRTMHRMVGQAIETRRREASGGADDLLDYMLAAEDPETGRKMSSEDLVHNMQFFIVAGHETTALALSWSLYLLANSPEHQERAQAEARAQLSGRAATASDLDKMPFVEQVLDEAMRLYPPVGLLARNVLEEDELCERQVLPNDTLFLPIWALHRHEMWWDKPEEFDPDRFGPKARVGRNKYQYLPFGAGPRVCVGADFAMTQARIILATLVQRFRFSPALPPAPSRL
jgi:cytochrome P450